MENLAEEQRITVWIFVKARMFNVNFQCSLLRSMLQILGLQRHLLNCINEICFPFRFIIGEGQKHRKEKLQWKACTLDGLASRHVEP